MKILSTLLAGLAVATMPVAASAQSATERGEARLAEMLEGRVAGEPVNCINAVRSNDLEIIDGVGFVYERGDTIYVARATNPRSLSRNDIVVIRRFGSQLCAQDIIRTIDRSSAIATGVVFLEDFVPYTKPEE